MHMLVRDRRRSSLATVRMGRVPARFVMEANTIVRTKARISTDVECLVKYASKMDYQGYVHGDFMLKLLQLERDQE